MAAPFKIARQARHEVACSVAVKKAAFLILQDAEQPASQVIKHALRGFFKHDNHDIAKRQPQKLHAQHSDKQPNKRGGIPPDNNPINKD
jgi:hypothetical protein